VVTTALGATGTAAAFTAFRAGQLELFVALAAIGAAIDPNIPSVEPAGPVVTNLFGVWALPVAILLPPLYGLVAPIPLLASNLWRRPGRNVYRHVFSAAALGLTCGGASVVIHLAIPAMTGAGPGLVSPLGWVLIATSWTLAWVILDVLIRTAVKGSDPTASVPGPLTRRVLRHDVPELGAGIAITFALSLGSSAAIAALPVALRSRDLSTDPAPATWLEPQRPDDRPPSVAPRAARDSALLRASNLAESIDGARSCRRSAGGPCHHFA
jgi:hypothetical protein